MSIEMSGSLGCLSSASTSPQCIYLFCLCLNHFVGENVEQIM